MRAPHYLHLAGFFWVKHTASFLVNARCIRGFVAKSSAPVLLRSSPRLDEGRVVLDRHQILISRFFMSLDLASACCAKERAFCLRAASPRSLTAEVARQCCCCSLPQLESSRPASYPSKGTREPAEGSLLFPFAVASVLAHRLGHFGGRRLFAPGRRQAGRCRADENWSCTKNPP